MICRLIIILLIVGCEETTAPEENKLIDREFIVIKKIPKAIVEGWEKVK